MKAYTTGTSGGRPASHSCGWTRAGGRAACSSRGCRPAGRHAAADDRPPAAAGGRARDQGRNQARAPGRLFRLLGVARRRDRGARPEERRDPGARLVSDVQAERVRGPRRREEARQPGPDTADGREGQLPGGRPRDLGPVSRRLDLQGHHRARGARRSTSSRPTTRSSARRLLRAGRAGETCSRRDVQELGTRTSTSRWT